MVFGALAEEAGRAPRFHSESVQPDVLAEPAEGSMHCTRCRGQRTSLGGLNQVDSHSIEVDTEVKSLPFVGRQRMSLHPHIDTRLDHARDRPARVVDAPVIGQKRPVVEHARQQKAALCRDEVEG